MALGCELCGKGRQMGYNVSHANNKTKKTWRPNVQRIRGFIGGTIRRVRVCTRCIRAGKVPKVPVGATLAKAS